MRGFVPAFALVLAGFLPAQDAAKPAAAQDKVTWMDAYPTDKCIISGRAAKVTFQAGGRTFMTCCENCQAKIEKDPASYTGKLDDAIAAAQDKGYALGKCPVSGKELGSMGKPHSMVLGGTLVKLCCAKCSDKATQNGEKIVAEVKAAAVEKQRNGYSLKTCPVSGDALKPGECLEAMYGMTLVRFCCEDCMPKFKQEPQKYLSKLMPAGATDKADKPGKEKKKGGKKKDKKDQKPDKDGEGSCDGDCEGDGAKACCQQQQGQAAKPACCELKTKPAAKVL